MQDTGLNAYSANPYMASIRRLAPSISQAWQMERANDPTQTANSLGTAYGDYGQFMRNNLANGSLISQVQQGQQQLPQLISNIRGFRDQMGQGGNVLQTNPFLAAESDALFGGNGQGTVEALAALYGPMMSRGMASAYGTNLAAGLQGAQRNLANDPINTQNDIWTYLLGM
jgi:hypothetical protein